MKACLSLFYLDIFNIAKFHWIFLWMIITSTTSANSFQKKLIYFFMMIFWWWYKTMQFPTSQTNSLMLLKSSNLWGPLKTTPIPHFLDKRERKERTTASNFKGAKRKKLEEKHTEFWKDSPVEAVTCYNCYVSFSRILNQRLLDQVC